MNKLWQGRTDGKVNKIADDFNSSIKFDKRLYKQDISGSVAHAEMLKKQGIITPSEAIEIISGLNGIKKDIESGKLEIDLNAEDIHTFIETELTKRIGEAGKKLHTARSRNDQVALDIRAYLISETDEIISKLKSFISVLTDKAEEYYDLVMPGYTHLQRAQPITFGHHLMAYTAMFLRDIDRFQCCKKRTAVSPIGSCALAGTTYDTDRFYEAEILGFNEVCFNSIDGVSDRDFIAEILSCLAITQAHLSRLAEEIVIWTTQEFSFVKLSDGYTTGSSIMPQKKNSDMAELVRGKTGRVYGDLMAILTVLKGLPLAYNKDMQEDKELVFDGVDTVKNCLEVFTGMVAEMRANKEKMSSSAKEGFINATDLADYLVKKGLPFRTAYKICGEIVGYCVESGNTLETLSIEEYKKFSELFDTDLYDAIDLSVCVKKRTSYGGTSLESVKAQIKAVREKIK